MKDTSSAAKIVKFRPKASELEAIVQSLANNTSCVLFTNHALERMDQREIIRLDVLRVLRIGHIKGDIEAGKNAGEWKCKFVARLKGSRDIGVVTLVISNAKLLIKTVEWEDLS